MTWVKGFTLLELIFTITILVIALSIGVPTLSQWVQRSKTSDLQFSLLHSIHFARTQATLLQSTITLCPGSTVCERNCGDSLLIFIDQDSNGTKDQNEVVLKQINIGQLGQYLNWRSFRRTTYIKFNAQGITPALNGTFHFCPNDPENEFKFSIILARTGRARVSDTPNCQ